ncbi:EAL domain-containing protein, partial [Metabacillus niabensis]|uniref:EAL domain-containing protein n=1 Tax=Metabacillus niabensis TaxID=324854 RepID=UPI001CFAC0F3
MDTIQINRSYISTLPNNQQDAAIISALIALARELNIQIIAEGIETKEQLEFLLSKGGTDFQEYYFSLPLQFNKIIELIKSSRGKNNFNYFRPSHTTVRTVPYTAVQFILQCVLLDNDL